MSSILNLPSEINMTSSMLNLPSEINVTSSMLNLPSEINMTSSMLNLPSEINMMSSILILPFEIVIEITMFLNIRDLLILKKICRHFYDYVQNDVLWKQRLFTKYCSQKKHFKQLYDKGNTNYHKIYVENYVENSEIYNTIEKRYCYEIPDYLFRFIKRHKEFNIFANNAKILKSLISRQLFDITEYLLDMNCSFGSDLQNIVFTFSYNTPVNFLEKLYSHGYDFKRINNKGNTYLHEFYANFNKCYYCDYEQLKTITIFLIKKGVNPLHFNNDNNLYIQYCNNKELISFFAQIYYYLTASNDKASRNKFIKVIDKNNKNVFFDGRTIRNQIICRLQNKKTKKNNINIDSKRKKYDDYLSNKDSEYNDIYYRILTGKKRYDDDYYTDEKYCDFIKNKNFTYLSFSMLQILADEEAHKFIYKYSNN